MGKNPILTIITTLMLALLLAACGGDDKATATPPPATQPPVGGLPYFGIGFNLGTGSVTISVDEDSPAERAGLQTGDVLNAINDVAITGANIVEEVQKYGIGDVLKVAVTRGTDSLEFNVTLEGRVVEAAAPVTSTQ